MKCKKVLQQYVAYPECIIRVILVLHNKHLETFPTKRVNLGDFFIHIFEEIVSINNRIELELNPMFDAELLERDKILYMIPFSATNFHVGVFVERVAGDG